MMEKSNEVSSLEYGNYPGSRSLEDHINNGFVLVDKPSGPTSHQVTAWVRDMFGLSKAGHSGTLDPKVTGLLAITLGNATKIMPMLMGMNKEYIGIMTFHKDVDEDDIRKTFSKFQSKIKQTPPKKSAVKRVEREREIFELEILEIDEREVLFRCYCEAGTYIRKLCDDIGKLLGGGHMASLRRTRVGDFHENEAVTLQDLKDALALKEKDETALRSLIKPVEEGVKNSGQIYVKDSAVDAICHGAPLSVGGITRVSENIEKDDNVAILTGKGELVGIGKSMMTSENITKSNDGIAVKTDRILMERGTYPSTWRKTNQSS